MGALPKSILVMGMHRSGTSCVTEVLEAYGVSLGPQSELMPATTANPRGYFENMTFNQICIDLLHAADADWWKVSKFDSANIPAPLLEKAKADLGQLIASLDGTQVFALKDPRLCFLLPVLRPLFPNPVFVHVVRSPIEVAMSLNERNGFGMAEGIALWEAYNRASFEATAHEPRVMVNYGALTADPAATSAELIENLRQLNVPGLALKEGADISELVSTDLHRQRYTGPEVRVFLTDTQQRFWADLEHGRFPKLRESAQAQRHRTLLLSCLEVQSDIQTMRSQENRRAAEKHTLAHLADDVQQLRSELNILQEPGKAQLNEAKLASLEAELSETQAELRSLNAELQWELDKTQRHEAKLTSLEAGLSEAQSMLDLFEQAQNQAHSSQERQRADCEQLIETLQSELNKAPTHEAALSSLEAELSAVKTDFRRFESQLSATRNQSVSKKIKRLISRQRYQVANKHDAALKPMMDQIRSEFDGWYYLAQNADVEATGMDPFVHYLKFGWQEGRDPHPGITNLEFLRKYPEICGGNVPEPDPEPEAQEHIMALPDPELTQVQAAQDIPDAPPVADTSDDARTLSYLETKQEVLESGLWDERWYMKHNSREVMAWASERSEHNAPIDHYLQVGWKAGYSPSRIFKHKRSHDSGDINPISNFMTRKRPNYHFDENVWIPEERSIAEYLAQKAHRTSKKVVYCCIIDGYDALIQPYHINPEWDYVCFTNDAALIEQGTQGVWEIREALRPERRSDRRNRYHKMHPHELFPEYDESIYVDGNVNIISSYLFDEIRLRNLPILLPQHFCRHCIYDEIGALFASHRTSAENLEILPVQMEFLRKMGFPEGYGMTENNVIFRRHHHKTVKRIMTRWWDLLCTFSSRDQTGLSYALWKEGIKPQDVSFPNTRFLHRDFWVFRHESEPLEGAEVVIDQKITPAFDGGCVPVLLSCNESFVGYLGIVLTSLIENSSADRNYDIIVLHKDLTDASKEKVGALAKQNVSIRFYNMTPVLEQLEGLDIYVAGYVPIETYNKCFLSEITHGYDKLVYIDTDIVIRADIAELYDTDLFGKALGASPNVANIHAAYQNTEIRGRNFGDYLTNTLGVERFENYFQAGIITLDMTSEKARDLLRLSLDKLREIKEPIFFDQCIFNSIFNEDVFYLSTTWNHVWYLQHYSYLKYSLQSDIFFDYAKSRLDPKIVHYASGDKPTNKFDWRLSSYFWDYASRSPYADELLAQLDEKKAEDESSVPALADLRSEPAPRTLVHLHGFYEDQMDYMLKKLGNINGTSWDLVVTANDNFEAIEAIVKAKYENATVLQVKNQGFDAYPFLKALQAKNLSHYDYVLKLHTKNARPDSKDSLVYGLPVPGHKWRNDMVDALLKTKKTFKQALARFEAEPDLGGLAAPQYIFSTNENNEQKTYNLRHWMNEFGLESGTHYVGGTMFLARAYPFERLKSVNPDDLDFAAGDTTSGSHKNLAHVFERLFGLVLENEGLSLEGP